MPLLSFGKTAEEEGRLVAMDENFAIISFTPDGRILHANDNFLNALGYTLHEVVNNHHKMFCDKTYVNSTSYTQFWRDLAKGVSQIDEFERIRKDGSSIWIQASYTPVKDNNGRVTRVIKFAQDITESKQVINAVKEAVNVAKNGNMEQTITLTTRNEGIEELKNIINDLFRTVSEKVDGDLNKISNALLSYQNLDFTHRIQGNKLGQVSVGINSLADVVNKMLVENIVNGLTLDKSSDILLENVDILNKNSNQSAAALEETAAALEEVTSNVSNTTENVVKMASYANDVIVSAKNGQELSTLTDKSMDEINDQVSSINEAITVIDQIAFQTNILSLNAAVEAATAGEAGKGFAVVAQEVRNLASRSAEAAKEIKNIVEKANAKTQTGKEVAYRMTQGYEKLYENINNTIALIHDVETASKEQQAAILQINDAINQLDQQTQQNASIATQTYDVAIKTDEIAKLIVSDTNEKQFIGKENARAKDISMKNEIDSSLKIEAKTPKKSNESKVVKSVQSEPIRAVQNDHDEWESF